MDLALELVLLVAGFYLLAKSSDWLVAGSSVVAERMGVRQLVIGLTVVAWGTSAPEVVVSSLAAVRESPGMSMGNVLGSNIANIGLVLGISSLILPQVLHGRLARREAFWLLVSVGIFWWLCADGRVSRVDGVVLLGAVSIYNFQLLWEARKASLGAKPEVDEPTNWVERNPRLTVLGGMLALAAAAYITVESAQALAGRAGLSDEVVGLTVLAVGTSLPELAAGVSGALRGHSDISLGNVVGSNVFNVTGVVGVVALIRPFGGDGEPEVRDALGELVSFDFFVVMTFSLAALLLPTLAPGRHGRAKGTLLLAGFLGYSGYLLIGELLAPAGP